MEYEFTIGGRKMKLTSDGVARKLKDVEPGRIQTHAVQVNGKFYPMKQAFSEVTGLDLLEFTTSHARRVFARLGLIVKRFPGPAHSKG